MSEVVLNNYESANKLPSRSPLIPGNNYSANRQSNSLPRTLNQQSLDLKAQFSNKAPSDYKTNMMILPNIQIN